MDTAARAAQPAGLHGPRLDQADEAATMHIGAALIFDQVPETGGAPTFDRPHEPISRMLFAPRLFNLTITNVPGPQLSLDALGARMRELIPLAPLFADLAPIAIASLRELAPVDPHPPEAPCRAP